MSFTIYFAKYTTGVYDRHKTKVIFIEKMAFIFFKRLKLTSEKGILILMFDLD